MLSAHALSMGTHRVLTPRIASGGVVVLQRLVVDSKEVTQTPQKLVDMAHCLCTPSDTILADSLALPHIGHVLCTFMTWDTFHRAGFLVILNPH